MKLFSLTVLVALLGGWAIVSSAGVHPVRFVILGDRTGEAVPGVYEQIWHETASDHPDFVINVGDTIQGLDDSALPREWTEVKRMLRPYAGYRFLYTPGNHDVWDNISAAEYVRETKHPLHYGFDYQTLHISVLNNSETDELPAEELDWLATDLASHSRAETKFVFSHRPSWLFFAALKNPNFPLHQLAGKYGVRYVIAGHIHQMLHFDLDTVTYLSMASSGGHLRNSRQYEDGWFFQHTLVTIRGSQVQFEIKETGPPFGKARVSEPVDWGAAGLRRR